MTSSKRLPTANVKASPSPEPAVSPTLLVCKKKDKTKILMVKNKIWPWMDDQLLRPSLVESPNT